MLWKKDVLFCDISPTTYAISEKKEILKRHIKNLTGKEKFCHEYRSDKLPNLLSNYSSGLIKTGKGIDIRLQENKAENIAIASASMNGMVIHPGETFSFWKAVGKTTKRRGYKDGRVIENNRLKPGIGGIELSIAMMPEGLFMPWHDVAALHYGQSYEDYYPLFDHLYPMIYTGAYNKDSGWVAELSENASACFPGSVIGFECTEPMTSARLRGDIAAIRGGNHAGISFFRYGRMVLAVRDGQDTLLYNTYPGSATRLILSRENTEIERDCELEEASWLRVPGHWDLIRAFGRYKNGSEHYFDGELCVLDAESARLRTEAIQGAS